MTLLLRCVVCRIEEFPSPPTCGPCKDSLFRECADVTPVPPDIQGLETFSPVKANQVVGKKYCHERNYYNPAKYHLFLNSRTFIYKTEQMQRISVIAA